MSTLNATEIISPVSAASTNKGWHIYFLVIVAVEKGELLIPIYGIDGAVGINDDSPRLVLPIVADIQIDKPLPYPMQIFLGERILQRRQCRLRPKFCVIRHLSASRFQRKIRFQKVGVITLFVACHDLVYPLLKKRQ